MRQISIEEAEAQFLLLIEAALQGEEVIITQENQPIIKFVSLSGRVN
jgi:prevent-host-death family protein